MANLKDVLGPPKDEMAEEASEPVESGEDAYVSKLKDLFGLDDDKAQELRDVICGLAQEEMMEKEPEPEAGPGPKGKKAGIALILGK